MRKRVMSMLFATAVAFTTLFGGAHSFATKAEAGEETPEEEDADQVAEDGQDEKEAETDEKQTDPDMEQVYEMAPIDEKGAARIDEIPPVNKDDTWTICIYITGSNLEDGGRNTLSDVTDFWSDKTSMENANNDVNKMAERLTRYENELKASGLELPAYFYQPLVYMPPSQEQDNGGGEDFFMGGNATNDISEMTSGVWSDNIRLIIQTGGSKYWVNPRVNPNRVQRFEYYKGELTEVDNLPAQNVCDSEVLTDFLRFCKDNYESDHRMLVLWDHGGGPFGYGPDNIFNKRLSLRDIRSALRNVYLPNPNNPAFDIIGYDACLMSNLDVTHSLYGFASYYALSEEVEPGDGWDYGPIFTAMTNDPTLNGAQVGRAVADAYTDYYMKQNIAQPDYQSDITFSVLDAKKAEELYKAYGDLAKVQLIDAVSNPGVLAEIGRCADRATCYAMNSYNIYNLCDLANYVDYMVDSYPDECSRIKELIGETVLYHRENGVAHDSEGITAYIPFKVNSLYGLDYFLRYVYDISDDKNVTALYYYKQAGCLNEELSKYVNRLTNNDAEVLNLSMFKDFSKIDPEFDDYGFIIPLSEELQNMLTDYQIELSEHDEENNVVVSLGKDYCVYLDEEGNLASNFDGSWIFMDDLPLCVEPISYSTDYAQYRAHVVYEGYEGYIILTRDLNSDELYITGIKFEGNDISNENNTRNCFPLEDGASIRPVYEEYDITDESSFYSMGDEVIYKEGVTDFEYRSLANGKYVTATLIQDQRGDSYYSKVISVNMKNGNLSDWEIAQGFYGSTY